jgi:hypothetical protein
LLVDAVEESVEQVGAVALVVLCGVVALALQGGPELDAGLEEGAGFADGYSLSRTSTRFRSTTVHRDPSTPCGSVCPQWSVNGRFRRQRA